MKGKVEAVTNQKTGDSDRYEVSLTITIKKASHTREATS